MFPNAKREGWRLPFSSYLDSRPSTILLYDIKNEKSTKCIKQNQFYKYIFYGEGNTVIYQSPNPGERIKEGDTIMFYLG